MKVDLNADMREVFKRLAEKHNASLVEQEQHRTRNAEDPVRGRDEAPLIDER